MTSLIFNIVLPIIILQKGSSYFGPTGALIIALFFPISFGLFDYLKNKHRNYISVLGILNVSLTGGLALSGLQGIWFSIKEATFPLLIGLFVFLSSFTKKPFVKTLFLNPQFFKIHLIEEKINLNQKHNELEEHLKKSTVLLSSSFFVSSILNFVLAQHFFKPISETLNNDQKVEILNAQIAEMTTWSHIVILVPSMILLFFILQYVFKGLKKLTGLSFDELLQNESSKSIGGGGGISSSGK